MIRLSIVSREASRCDAGIGCSAMSSISLRALAISHASIGSPLTLATTAVGSVGTNAAAASGRGSLLAPTGARSQDGSAISSSTSGTIRPALCGIGHGPRLAFGNPSACAVPPTASEGGQAIVNPQVRLGSA